MRLVSATHSINVLNSIFDSLSAVDAHTARHLVVNCLSGPLMKDRTCILVTHHVRLCLPIAEMAIKMDSGTAEIVEIDGTDLPELKDVNELDGATATATPSSKAQTTGVNTPMKVGLITKEHRETVSARPACKYVGSECCDFVGFC